MNFTNETFLEVAQRDIIRRRYPRLLDELLFKRMFGVVAAICASIYPMIWTNLRTCNGFQTIEPKHLLWALYWMKHYTSESAISNMVATSAKTLRKWVKKIVFEISLLKESTVSDFNFI